MEYLPVKLAIIAAGGALGAVLRFATANGVHAILGRDFPYGTLAVNVLGSFCIGLGYILLMERMSASPEIRAFILIGFLGAFTTFSTFSLETFTLIESGEVIKAGVNVVVSVLLCLFVTWLGIIIARQL